jgi:hypothetical protein
MIMEYIATPRYGYTVFCDDLREEVGGKLSYMGNYRGVLNSLSPLPILIPKFVVIANFSEPLTDTVSDMIIRIYGPGQQDGDTPLFETTIPASVAAEVAPVADLPERDQRRELMVPVTFAPLEVGAGRIRVQVVRGEEIYRIGSLLVRGPDVPSATIADEPSRPS